MNKKLTGILLGGSLIFGGVFNACADQVAQNQNEPVKDVQEPIKATAQENVNQDISVADAVAEALDNNLDIKVKEATKKVYKSNYKTYSLKKLGNIKLTNHAYKSSDSSGKELQEYGYDGKYLSSKRNAGGIQLTIPILDTVLDANISQAGLQSNSAKRLLQKQIEDTTFAVQNAYYYIQYYTQQEIDAKNAFDEMAEHYKLAKLKCERKKVSQLDVFNAQVELAKAETDYIEAKSNKKIYMDELRKILNVKPNVKLNLTEKLNNFKLLDSDKDLLAKPVDELVALALQNRQDLKIAANDVKIAKHGVTAAIGESLPKFSLVAANSWSSINHTGFDDFAKSLGYDTDTRSSDQNRTIGVYMSLNLDASNISSVDTAKKKVELQKANLENKKLSIEADVKQTHQQIIKALQQIKSTGLDVQLAHQANDFAGMRYYKDLCSSEARTDARKELTRALTNHNYALAEAKVCIAKLKNLIGNNVIIK